MKQLVVVVAVAGLLGLGCNPAPHTRTKSSNRRDFGIIEMGGQIAYLIDPRTETCALVWGESAVTVDCHKLARAVPEAAPFVTWPAPAAAQ